MKKLTVLLALVIFFLISCQENEPELSIPQWLKVRNQYDESYVMQNPKSMLAYGKWIRTKWEGQFYFEYNNPLSSSMYSPISYDNDTLSFYWTNNSTDYFKQKCCSEVVWKGSGID